MPFVDHSMTLSHFEWLHEDGRPTDANCHIYMIPRGNADMPVYFLSSGLLHQKVGPMRWFSVSQVALVSGRYSLVSYRISMLYDTSEYSPGHQCHLGEAIKTNIKDPPFDEVSTPLIAMVTVVTETLETCCVLHVTMATSNWRIW